MKNMARKQAEAATKQEVLFTKKQILASKKYENRRDALGAILSDNGSYSQKQVDSLLEKFMKGKVK